MMLRQLQIQWQSSFVHNNVTNFISYICSLVSASCLTFSIEHFNKKKTENKFDNFDS